MSILDCIILAILVVAVSWEGEVNKVLTRMIDHKKAIKYEISQILRWLLNIFNEFLSRV